MKAGTAVRCCVRDAEGTFGLPDKEDVRVGIITYRLPRMPLPCF